MRHHSAGLVVWPGHLKLREQYVEIMDCDSEDIEVSSEAMGLYQYPEAGLLVGRASDSIAIEIV